MSGIGRPARQRGIRRWFAAAGIAAGLLALPVDAANTGSLTLSATVLSKNVCRFNSTATALNFGNIDPTSAAPVTVTLSLVFRCNGSDAVATWAVSSDDGLHELGAGQPRMQHAASPVNYLPYSLSFPASGSAPRNVNQTISVIGTLSPANFSTAIAGSYSDTLVLSILP